MPGMERAFVDKPRILVVDDEEQVRKALERWFQICGFEVDMADDGDVAVEKCAATKYDVITMDLEMPHMNGVNAIAAIRSRCPNLPNVALTGYPADSDKARNCGAAKILTKPVRLHELQAEVCEALDAARSRE